MTRTCTPAVLAFELANRAYFAASYPTAVTTSSPNLYTKLGVHSRAEAVESARTLRTPTLSQAMPDNFEPNGPWFTALAPV